MQTYNPEMPTENPTSCRRHHGNSSYEEKPQPLQHRYQVLPISKHFFHIKEVNSGKVLGFRCKHNEACKLARDLEQALA